MSDTSTALVQTDVSEGLLNITRRLLDLIERDYMELRQALADLDDATPSRHAFDQLASRLDELHSRLDELELRR